MTYTIWIDKTPDGEGAVYLLGAGGPEHLDGHTRDRYLAVPGTVVIEGTNPDVSASYRRVARGL